MDKLPDRIKRGVSLPAKVNGDLMELCQYLGVNVHSWMVNEIAKAVQRERAEYKLKSRYTEDNTLEDNEE